MELTQEQKRIKIAEACGMTGWREASMLPDYFHDLNAMHEAVSHIPDGARPQYRRNLSVVVNGLSVASICTMPDAHYDREVWKYINATAAQRAEAFGKTLNLW